MIQINFFHVSLRIICTSTYFITVLLFLPYKEKGHLCNNYKTIELCDVLMVDVSHVSGIEQKIAQKNS